MRCITQELINTLIFRHGRAGGRYTPGSAEDQINTAAQQPRYWRNGLAGWTGAGIHSHPGRPWTEQRQPSREAGTTMAWHALGFKHIWGAIWHFCVMAMPSRCACDAASLVASGGVGWLQEVTTLGWAVGPGSMCLICLVAAQGRRRHPEE